MVTGPLTQAYRYAGLHPLLPRAFEYLANTDLDTLATGTHELDGRRVYAVVQEYVTKAPGQGVWESHRRYLDLQVVVRGTEQLGYAPSARMSGGAYDEERDVQPWSGPGDVVTLHPGEFMLLWPGEVHMPGMAAGEPETVRKIVVKIAAD